MFVVVAGQECIEGGMMIHVDSTAGEFLECDCGNDVMDSGFYPADFETGYEVEPTAWGWDGKTWLCGKCGVVEEVMEVVS